MKRRSLIRETFFRGLEHGLGEIDQHAAPLRESLKNRRRTNTMAASDVEEAIYRLSASRDQSKHDINLLLSQRDRCTNAFQVRGGKRHSLPDFVGTFSHLRSLA